MAKVLPSISVSQAFDALLEQTEQRVRDQVRSKATLEMQRAHVRWWHAQIGPKLRLVQVDELVVDAIVERRPGRAGPATLRKRLSTLKGALELAHRRRQIPRVPALPKVIAPFRPRDRILETFEDAQRLYDSLNEALPHRALWCWVCLWTGQHAKDVDEMAWADVDLRLSTGLIRNSKNRMPVLRVRLPAPLIEVLRAEWRRERPRPTDKIVRPWPSRSHTLARHCRKLGLPELNAIDLRHTCLSWIVRRLGITPAVCRYAGHKSPVMMARTYARHLPPQLDEVTRELESMAAGGRL